METEKNQLNRQFSHSHNDKHLTLLKDCKVVYSELEKRI